MKQRLRILIVEDEVLIAMSLELELRRAGYDVCRRVTTGEEAVRTAQEDSPDCVLTDIRLPGGIDGIEAARLMQIGTNTPIIFMTGYSDRVIEERARQLHPLGYFTKPVRAIALAPLLESIVRNGEN